MAYRRTRLLWPALACLLSVAVAVPAAASGASEPYADGNGTSHEPSPGAPPPEAGGADHSSDITEPVLTARRSRTEARPFFTLHEQTHPVAPGLDLTRFDRYDARGWYRVSALTADLSTPGLRLDYAAAGKVSSPGPLSTALRRDGAIAGVNGDFFDIGDTGAPLGIGVDHQRGVVHGSRAGWNKTFTLDRFNVAAIAETYLRASIARRGKPPIPVTNLNAPTLRPGGIGIYTPAWGAASRNRVLPGSAPRREVVVRHGRVRAKRKRLSSGPIPAGTVHLVGVGEGAKRLGRLRVGARVSVEYGINTPATRVAVGGSVVLLRDGKVLAPGDLEMHPRTAIGIDRDLDRVIIVAVDGRSATSRGLTMKETAVLLRQMGAEDGLNLDGGGSSTMIARESGEPVSVVNDPSDGSLRSVPNGLGFAFARGSGRLRGIRIEPVAAATDSHRVLRGFSRRLVARGHDETHAPVPVKPRWTGSASATARTGPGLRTVVRGRRTGIGTVTATAGRASGTFRMRVLGRVHRLEASQPTLALAGRGASASLEVRGYDARGFGTWVEPRDLRLSYDRDELRVTRTGRELKVTSRVRSAGGVLTISAGGRSTSVGVAIGLARKVVHRMNGRAGWGTTSYPAASQASLRTVSDRHGRAGKAVAMSYSLRGRRSPRAAYLTATPPKDLPGRARRVGLWVRGDGKGALLRLMLRDESGSRATATLAGRVSWRGWRFVAAPVPAGLSQPVDLVRVYAVETRKRRRYSGTLAFDDLTVFTERVASVPPSPPLRDPMVTDLAPLEPGGLRVAVLSGSRVSAARPRSGAVARTRRAMREIVAARPDLVLINGDLLARGGTADVALARRLIREELGDSVPWHYLPGDGERGRDDDLAAFRAEFGNPVQVFDQAGTRIVLLNSAQGALRLGGFGQLVRLRSALSSAARDQAVHAVMVVAHHSTSDPTPGSSAELTDPREAELVEGLLADFRAASGKSVAYVGSHARRFATTRHDDVPQVLAGPVSWPTRSTTGSFVGWSLLRIKPGEELDVEFRPQVNRLRIVAPDNLGVGRTADVGALLNQGRRRIPVGYPMNAHWVPSRTLHIGPASMAPDSAVVALSPATGRLTALRAGTAELIVRVNGVNASRELTVR